MPPLKVKGPSTMPRQLFVGGFWGAGGLLNSFQRRPRLFRRQGPQIVQDWQLPRSRTSFGESCQINPPVYFSSPISYNKTESDFLKYFYATTESNPEKEAIFIIKEITSMLNVIVSSAVSIELFTQLQNTAQERQTTISALVRHALSSMLEEENNTNAHTEEHDAGKYQN